VPPARPSRTVSLEACGPLCDRLRSGRVAPRVRLERSRWRKTPSLDQLWAELQRRGHWPRRRDPLCTERGAVRIRVRACGRHRRQRPPLQRGRGDVVRACFVAAAIFVGGRVASREGGRACSRAVARPLLSLAAAVAPFARARCAWRPSLLCAAAGARPLLDEGAAGGGLPHLFGGRFVRKRPPFARCPRGPLREVGDLRRGSRVSDCARTGRCGSMVHPAPRSISKTERRRGLRQFFRMC